MNQEDRLGAVMVDHAARITADAEAEKASRKKERSIQITFNGAELARLKDAAAANGLNLQDYIRRILKTYG
jgi:predicted DNA binding CopG/RHH family protein